MLSRLFNNTQPYTLIFLFLVLLLVRLPILITATEVPTLNMAEPLGALIFEANSSWLSTPWLNVLTALLILTFQAVYFNKITSDFNFYPRSTYVPALIYGVVLSVFPQYLFLSPFLILNFFVLWALQKMFSIYKSNIPIQTQFDIGILIGVACLFYFPLVWMVVVAFVATFFLRTLAWREVTSLLIGFVVPFLFSFTAYYWMDNTSGFWNSFSSVQLNTKFFQGEMPWNKFSLVVIVPLFLWLIMAINNFLKTFVKTIIVVRKYFQILVVMVVLGLLSFLFAKNNDLYHFFWVGIPISFIVTNYIIRTLRPWISEPLFMVVIVALISLQLF